MTIDTRLGNTLQFNEEDLAANRAGELSKGQVARLQSIERISAGCLLITIAVMLFIGVITALTSSFTLDSPIFFFGVFIAGCAAFVWWKVRSAARVQQIERTSGIISKRIENGEDGDDYAILVEGRKFWVKKPAFDLFEDNATYTLYHLRGEHGLLSAERIGE